MKQEIGETRDAMIEDDEKRIQAIINENKHLRDPYWIVLFAKQSKNCVDGKHTIVKHIKAYKTKPSSMVGMCVGTVNNQTGEIKWEINMPQRPFDYDGLLALGAQESADVVTETTSIPSAYITQ